MAPCYENISESQNSIIPYGCSTINPEKSCRRYVADHFECSGSIGARQFEHSECFGSMRVNDFEHSEWFMTIWAADVSTPSGFLGTRHVCPDATNRRRTNNSRN